MQWQEQGVVLAVKPFSEASRIVTVFSRNLGKTSGLVKNSKAVIQLGDICDVVWRGRNPDQLGTFQIESIFSAFSFAFENPMEIYAIDSACTLCMNGLPDKAPHEKLFDSLKSLMLNLIKRNWLSEYVFFERQFLSEAGIGLDFSKCAVTGCKEGLFYVSPRTGRAVTKEVGEKYKDKLFTLPKFLLESAVFPSIEDVLSALSMMGHFLKMYFCDISGKGLPLSRQYLVQGLSNEIGRKGNLDENQYDNQS